MVNKSIFEKEISMNPTTLYAHPFFAINLSRNFKIEPDEFRTFVSGMPNWKYVEVEGMVHCIGILQHCHQLEVAVHKPTA